MKSNKLLLSIIIPVFNEEKNIEKIIRQIFKLKKKFHFEIIVINDGSTDKTHNKIIKVNNYIDKYLPLKRNHGKGFAVKKGVEISTGEYIFFQDADLEYDPNDILKFIKIIKKFNPDLIIGSRFNYSDYTRSHYIWNKLANLLITFLFNLLYNTTFTDIYSCYACYKKKIIEMNDIKSRGFEQHAEILCEIVKKGGLFYEIPINYNGRNYKEGKKIKFYHLVPILLKLIKCRIY